MHTKSGFTIVELIVVITVIAILATVSIIAFNGVQEQARNAQLLTSVDAAEKTLRLYHAEHGRYPDMSDMGDIDSYTCIGRASDYPAENGFEDGSCLQMGGGVAARHSPIFNQLLQPYTSNLSIDTKAGIIQTDEASARGLIYIGTTNDGTNVADHLLPGG